MHINQLENYLKVCGLKISGNKNELVARVFSAHGQCKNSHVTSQANVFQLMPLDRSVVRTLDMLDFHIVRSLDHQIVRSLDH